MFNPIKNGKCHRGGLYPEIRGDAQPFTAGKSIAHNVLSPDKSLSPVSSLHSKPIQSRSRLFVETSIRQQQMVPKSTNISNADLPFSFMSSANSKLTNYYTFSSLSASGDICFEVKTVKKNQISKLRLKKKSTLGPGIPGF